MVEEKERNVKEETGQVTFRAKLDVSMDPLNDPNKLNSVQYMIYHEALMTLNSIYQALSCIKTKSKSHIDIESDPHHYRISCRLTPTMETPYNIDACIILTTDSTGSLIADSSSRLVKLVQDIETLCRELSKS